MKIYLTFSSNKELNITFKQCNQNLIFKSGFTIKTGFLGLNDFLVIINIIIASSKAD